MASSPSTSSPPTTDEPKRPDENDVVLEHQEEVTERIVKEKECVHKTKTIQFMNRSTPIILQNDNGPCPLLAICNVLLLRNNLNLSGDTTEVPQEKLLSLVAERLIDSNSNIDNKDAGYLENQQQNISDAIDLLPRLATGIDVNIKFRRIDDFEFTRECAIFDLLDIPLYHGWIVDPQDYDTANAIGSKSYNAIMSELVALETRSTENDSKINPEEDCVDFAAATTATLGVPSPCLSKNRSFDDSPRSILNQQIGRKGDLEEEAELLRALRLSEADLPTSVGDLLVVNADSGVLFSGSDGSAPSGSVDTSEGPIGLDLDQHPTCGDNGNFTSLMTTNVETLCSTSKTDQIHYPNQSAYTEHGQLVFCNNAIDPNNVEVVVPMENKTPPSHEENTGFVDHVTMLTSQGGKIEIQPVLTTNGHEAGDISSELNDTVEVAGLVAANLESDASNTGVQNIDASENFTSSVDGSEPIYEGEECILESGTNFEDREPMYEGEVILAEQADKTVRSKDEITPQQGELIRNFLKNSASQLTFYGLFCLQGGLKERELCVFFRNNHFSTMFKYNGELYLLATDQGYINQPDLVWEKLNEVNGDTLFMMGNFKEFKVESHANETWNEHNAMASTADFLASIDTAAESGLDMNSDLQLAIALQQQEFEQQQQQQQQQQQPQRQSMPQTGKLITGPQVPSSSRKHQSSSSKVDAKSKEKCVVM